MALLVQPVQLVRQDRQVLPVPRVLLVRLVHRDLRALTAPQGQPVLRVLLVQRVLRGLRVPMAQPVRLEQPEPQVQRDL